MARLNPNHALKLAQGIYVLRAREWSGKNYAVPGNPVAGKDGHFPFTVNPQHVGIDQAVRVAIMQTRDYASSDEQGLSPVTYTLNGQFLITPNEFNLTNYGMQRALEDMIEDVFNENVRRRGKRQPLLMFTFHDFYQDQHWQVLPANLPRGQRDASTPTVEQYSLKLLGIRPVNAIKLQRKNPTSRAARYNRNVKKADYDSVLRDSCPYFDAIQNSCRLEGCFHQNV